MEPNWGHNRGLETRWLGELDLEDLPRFLGGLGWFVMDIPRGLGGPGRFLRDVPRGLRGPGRFLRDVPRGLGGRVGQERESTRAEDGSGDASWATRGEEKGGNSQVTEGWRSIWICGSVDLRHIQDFRQEVETLSFTAWWPLASRIRRILTTRLCA
jgi:hypothetical protein